MADATDHRPWALARVRGLLADGEPRRVVGVMVASLDARAALEGRSGGLSSAADRALLKAWRTVAGAILVGARTLETERYGSLIPDADRRARTGAGRHPWPRVLTISRRLDIDLGAALSIDPGLPLTVYTTMPAPPRGTLPGTDVEVVTLPRVTPAAVVADARSRYGAQVIACEGGPRLLARALADGVLTDLSLTLAPVIVRRGPPLLPDDDAAAGHGPVLLDLRLAEDRDGCLFAHYALG